MKKIYLIGAMLLMVTGYSQEKQTNPFLYEEQAEVSAETNKAPGTPADPVPIDGSLPALFIAAIAIMLYARKKRLKDADLS